MTQRPRLIVGISGASGAIFGVRTLEALRELDVESHLILSRAAEVTIAQETEWTVKDVHALADVVHAVEDIGAGPSSGSFRSLGMIVAPCSVRSLSEIAAGIASTLLTRAADVTLKERRRLVLLLRETPLHLGHLRAACAVTEMGGVIAPPVPSFYSRPANLDEMVDHTVGRALDLFGLDTGRIKRW
ncbi:MAG: 3-octaprenyl-4-hydroxybenzoate carboxy-lyase, partial [Alphaproteobacteria bacterium RIFOXYD12_FULL_60_8]